MHWWGLAKGLIGQYITVCAFSQNGQKFFPREINGFWRKDGAGAICCSQGIKATDGRHEDKATRRQDFLNFYSVF